jgi:hypothetical protein
MIGAEVVGQGFLAVILYLEARSLLSRVYADDPTGSMTAFGAMFALQPNLLRKIHYLKGQTLNWARNTVNSPSAIPLAGGEPPEQRAQ